MLFWNFPKRIAVIKWHHLDSVSLETRCLLSIIAPSRFLHVRWFPRNCNTIKMLMSKKANYAARFWTYLGFHGCREGGIDVMACALLPTTSILVTSTKKQGSLSRVCSSKDFFARRRLKRSYSSNHLCYSVNPRSFLFHLLTGKNLHGREHGGKRPRQWDQR